MDGYRGLAMILVILLHSAGQYKSVAHLDHVPGLDQLTGFFDPYRMPVLMMLSGLLIGRALAKPLGTYLDGKVRKLLWPFLVWSLVHFVATRATGEMLEPLAWLDGTYQWFLAVLMACFLVAPVTRWIPPWVIMVLFLVTLEAIGAHVPELRRTLYFGSYFFLGAGLMRWLPRLQSLPGWTAALLGLAGLAVALGSATDLLNVVRSNTVSALYPVPGLLAMLWLGPRLARARALEWVGRHSIVFYVAHTGTLIVAGQVWRASDAATPWWTAVVLLVLALGVPAFLAVNRVHFSGLFELPRPPAVARPRREDEGALSRARGSGLTA